MEEAKGPCPLCDLDCRSSELPDGSDGIAYDCKNCGSFFLVRTASSSIPSLTPDQKALVSYYARHHQTGTTPFVLHTGVLDEVFAKVKLPTISEQADNALAYLAQTAHEQGKPVKVWPARMRAVLGAKSAEGVREVLAGLAREGHIEQQGADPDVVLCSVTFEGWRRYEEIISVRSSDQKTVTQQSPEAPAAQQKTDQEPAMADAPPATKPEPAAEPTKVDVPPVAKAESEAETKLPVAGGRTRITRKADREERCLDVDQYAGVLSQFFRSAEGEFSFALLGPWGRGKTYLMEVVEEKLATQDEGRYKVVWFSAWKYRTTPEVWVYLYETFAEACSKSGWKAAFPRWARTWIVRYGYGSVLLAFILTAFASVAVVRNLREVAYFLTTGGVAVAVLGHYGKLFALARRLGERFKERSAFVVQHGEKLGLQAAIGKDLHALVLGWMPGKDFAKTYVDTAGNRAAWYVLVVVLVLVAFAFLPLDPRHTIPWLSAAVQQLNPWIAWCLALPLYVAVAGASMVLTRPRPLTWKGPWGRFKAAEYVLRLLSDFRSRLFGEAPSGSDGPDRALLVVDDLDRCDQGQMLEIVESLKLMLEEQEIHRRVQQVVLVEEDALACAIYQKFEKLARYKAEDEKAVPQTQEQIARDHVEKLFISHLRLVPLTGDELATVAEKHIAQNLKKGVADEGKAPYAAPGPDVPLPVPIPSVVDPAHEDMPRKSGEEARRIADVSTVYTEDEQKALEAAVRTIGESEVGKRWGPRLVRAFLFKYQLARMLLAKQASPPSPEDLVKALQDAVLGIEPDVDSALSRIVEQVR